MRTLWAVESKLARSGLRVTIYVYIYIYVYIVLS